MYLVRMPDSFNEVRKINEEHAPTGSYLTYCASRINPIGVTPFATGEGLPRQRYLMFVMESESRQLTLATLEGN